MKSIGNDIVALDKINPNRTKEKIFFSKILSTSEMELYQNQFAEKLPFEKFIWLSWSIKESVYKFHKRNYPCLLFSPVKIMVEDVQFPVNQNRKVFSGNELERVSFNNAECFCCIVKFNAQQFYTRSFLFDDLIYTVANNRNNFENIYWGIKKIEESKYTFQSVAVRKFILKKLTNIFHEESFCFEKNDAGIPFIRQKKNIKVSFTHHGNFVAYSFLNSD